MSFISIAGAGAAKTAIAVTVSLHPGAAHQASHSVTVRSGDSLSSISQRALGNAADWPALWWANRHSVPNPSLVRVGQHLRLPEQPKVSAWLTRAALAAIPGSAPVGGGRRAARAVGPRGRGQHRVVRSRAGRVLQRRAGQLPVLRDPA